MDVVRFCFPCFLLFVDVTPMFVSKLIGIKLCRDDCFQAGGCKGFNFDHVHLRCELKDDSRYGKTTRSGEFFKSKKHKKCKLATCHVGERCIRTRHGGCVCVQTKESNLQEMTSVLSSLRNRTASFVTPSPNNSKQNESPVTESNCQEVTSVLSSLRNRTASFVTPSPNNSKQNESPVTESNLQEMTSVLSSLRNRTASFVTPSPNNSKQNESPVTGRGKSLKQHLFVIPKNSTCQAYSYKVSLDTMDFKKDATFPMTHVLAVVYLDQLQQLLVSTSNPGKIRFSDLTGNEIAVLKYGVYAFAMTHDEGRQVVFYLESGAHVKVMKVSIRTKQSEIVRKHYGLSCLTVDTSKQVLYTTDRELIMLFSYKGHFVKEVRKIGVNNLFFAESSLYYSVGCKVFKTFRHKTSESFVTKLKVIPQNFEFNGHTLFTSSPSTEDLLTIDVINPLLVNYISLPSAFANDTVLCVIP